MKHTDTQMIGRQSSRHFWSVVWRHNRIAILILSLLSVISLVFATRWINAQEPVPTLALREAAIEPKLKQDSKSAWDDLQQSAQSRLSSANDQTATARAIMDDLLDFATAYSGTEEAVLARFNHGVLASALGDYETAESSLNQAMKEAKDPQLVAAIRAQLGQLTIRAGRTPPDFTASSLDGRKVSLSGYKGKVVLLDFWATWCGPCIVELPNVKRIYEKYNDEGFEIVSISLDRNEEMLRTFVKRSELDWTHIYNLSLPPGQDIASQYGVEAIPQMILVGRHGKIVDTGLRGPVLEEAVKYAVGADKRSSAINGSRPVFASIGQSAPELAVQEWVRGEPTTLDELQGKVVLLDIFQIICPGCHAAHPEIVRMQERYADRGFEVLGLAVAFEYESVQTSKHIRDYVRRKAYPYSVAIDEGLTKTFRRYRSRGTPYTVLIDRKGRIRYLDFFRLNQVEATVQRLLDEEAS